MNFWRWMAGEVTVQLTCADRERALQTILGAGMTVRDAAEMDGLTLSFRIPASKLRILKKLSSKKGWELKLLKREGFGYFARRCLARPVMLSGILLVMAASVYLPSRVLFVKVEGNQTVPTRLILEKAAQCGIGFGSSRQAVRSQKMKDALLDAMPELQWAGVNTAGCTATITVRERAEKPEQEETTVSSIVAVQDGVITAITVTQGSARYTVGQAVKAGEVLISGYTDCGFCIRAQRAQGEVFARTNRELRVVTPTSWCVEGEIQSAEKKYALIIGKKRINFYKGSGISGTTCDKMYTEYYVTLPGGFQLPVSIVTEVWCSGTSCEVILPEESGQRLLEDFSDRYLTAQMNAGTVTERHREFTAGEGIFCLAGKYACIEMIGRQRNEGNLIGKYD